MIRKTVRGIGSRLTALADAWDRLAWCESSVGRLHRDIGHLRDAISELKRANELRELKEAAINANAAQGASDHHEDDDDCGGDDCDPCLSDGAE